MVLVAASDLKGALESLRYREHKRLAVQGLITAVRYVRLHPDPSEPNPDPSEPSGGEVNRTIVYILFTVVILIHSG